MSQDVHENYNVFDLEKSLKFYEQALGLTEKKRIIRKGQLLHHRLRRKLHHILPFGTYVAYGPG